MSGVLREEDCEVKGLYVAPEQQGKGIGKSLLGAMADTAKKANKPKLVIWTLDGARSNGFYQKQGGIKNEYKQLEIGGQFYKGAVFHIALKQ